MGSLPDEASSKSHDDALIDGTLAGDYDAFERLVARYRRHVFAIAGKFFRSPETVEDIALKTFAEAFFSLSKHRRGDSCERLLSRIAINTCYSELRRRRKRGDSRLADVTEDEAAWLETKLAGGSLELQFGERDWRRAAEIADKLLSRLSPEARLMVVLLHVEGRSLRESAQLMGWSELGARIRAFRARRELRRALERWTLTRSDRGK